MKAAFTYEKKKYCEILLKYEITVSILIYFLI